MQQGSFCLPVMLAKAPDAGLLVLSAAAHLLSGVIIGIYLSSYAMAAGLLLILVSFRTSVDSYLTLRQYQHLLITSPRTGRLIRGSELESHISIVVAAVFMGVCFIKVKRFDRTYSCMILRSQQVSNNFHRFTVYYRFYH